jgi:hypothetical protein
MIENIAELVVILKQRILAYHGMFSLPLIAEQWEEVLHRSFRDLGIETTWHPNRSHTVGEDMRLQGIENSRISCKSGTIQNAETHVKFSGGRSTTFATLEEKLNHFSGDHDDFYFLLSKKKYFDMKYQLLVFPSSLCKPNLLEWSETSSGWKGTGNFEATITQSMSGQLWTTLPLELIEHKYEIDCSINADTVKNALQNYEAFHGLGQGTATLTDVEGSSAGVPGWAQATDAALQANIVDVSPNPEAGSDLDIAQQSLNNLYNSA